MQVHTVCSGAMDRLHAEKDPCVKFDSFRKVWVYLHMDRTPEQFGKLVKLFIYCFICLYIYIYIFF